MLVIDQPFAGFLTNYFSTHMGWQFRIRILKLIPSTLIYEERYQKISFHKVTQNWLFWHRGSNKSFSFFFLYFLSPHFSSIFFFFFFFLLFFSSFFFVFLLIFLVNMMSSFSEKVKIKSAPWKLKVNLEIWSS